jgi:hypothetical protein
MRKYLRIMVSALSLTAGVLVIALWVRSYHKWDSFGWMTLGPWAIRAESVIWKIIFICEELGDNNELFFDGTLWELDSDDDIGGAKQTFVPGPLGFSYYVEENIFTQVVVPHWFLIFVSASIAAVPWLTWLRRFSLRTLLIATTLVAVGLGTVIYFSG